MFVETNKAHPSAATSRSSGPSDDPVPVIRKSAVEGFLCGSNPRVESSKLAPPPVGVKKKGKGVTNLRHAGQWSLNGIDGRPEDWDDARSAHPQQIAPKDNL